MPVFVLTSPEGKKYKVNAPEGATVEQAFEYLKQSEPNAFAPKDKTSTGIKPELGDLSGMPEPRPKAVQGLTVAQERGDLRYYDPVEAAKAVGREIVRAPGATYDVGAMLSNISPSTLLGVTPRIEPTGVEKTNEIFNLKQTPAEYAGFGLLGSLAAPTVIAKPIGLVARGGAAAANTLQNFTNSKLADYIAAAGNKAPEILNYLRGAEEIVPGSKPTVAQALAAAPEGGSAYTRFAGLQPSTMGAIPQDVRAAYYAREMQQRGARAASAAEVAGTPSEKAALEGARLGTTNPMYETARSPVNAVDVAPISQTISDVIAASPRHRDLTNKAESVLKNIEGITNGREAVSALDDLKSMIKAETDGFVRGQLTKIKDSFVKNIPGLEAAETTFREMSAPVNAMEIGTYLKKSLEGPVSGAKERVSTFARALENAPQTIKRSTGQARFTSFEDAGVPKADVEKLNNIKRDLERDLAAEELQSRSGLSISDDPNVKRVNLMSRVTTAFNEVVGTLAARIGRKKALEIATEMLDPQTAAKVLEQAMAMEKTQAARSAAAARVGPAIRNVGAAAVPVNALAPPNQNSLAGQ